MVLGRFQVLPPFWKYHFPIHLHLWGNKRKAEGDVSILQTYAQTREEIELFSDSSYLTFSEVLSAFPTGNVPRQPFTCRAQQWQLQSRPAPGGRTIHLAVLSSGSDSSTPDQQQQGKAKQLQRLMSTPEQQRSSFSNMEDMEGSRDLDAEELGAMQRYGSTNSNGAPPCFSPSSGSRSSYHRQSSGGDTHSFSSGKAVGCTQVASPHHHQQQQQQQQGGPDAEVRKFHRNLLHANNTRKETLERYKAIMSLIEACKRKVATHAAQYAAAGNSNGSMGGPGSSCWGSEPGASIVQSVLDVGEALASFGNHQFPEHSNEGRAILAGDYKALLKQYLSNFGWLFAQPTKQQLPLDLQEEVQSVGSLLATRCEAYDLLYDQLVRHVGLESRGGPSTLVLNHNSAAANPTTSITANPTNTTTASANSKSKAVNKGLGGAAIAAAGLAGLLLLRAIRGNGGGGGRGGRRGRGSGGSSRDGGGGADSSSSSSSSLVQQQRHLRIPKGRNGRELLLVSQLSACGDELRRARGNDELLKDDWRLGRHVRLAWPPGPPLPPGYTELAPDACNVSQLLQEMYG